jgi:hypothetical protein
MPDPLVLLPLPTLSSSRVELRGKPGACEG